MDAAMEEDKRNEAAALADFTAQVKETIDLGAGDEKTAIRWILDSMDLNEDDRMYGGDYICYTLGLSYSEAHRFEEFCN